MAASANAAVVSIATIPQFWVFKIKGNSVQAKIIPSQPSCFNFLTIVNKALNVTLEAEPLGINSGKIAF